MALGGTNFKLRSDVEKATYNSFASLAVGAKTAGVMEKVNDVVGVWVETSTSGEDNVFCYEASKILVPCREVAQTTNWTVGKKVFFVSADAEVDVLESGNDPCGIVVEEPAESAETVLIHLMGALGIYT